MYVGYGSAIVRRLAVFQRSTIKRNTVIVGTQEGDRQWFYVYWSNDILSNEIWSIDQFV
jgi:hypothetical protein